MSQIGLRSKDTPRKRFGMPVPMRRLCVRLMRPSRHAQGRATFVYSSSSQPLPSQSFSGQ
jgi:hypothetical protein